MESGEDGYMNANFHKVPLKKKKYEAYRMKEESKHCSAPGSQVVTDFFFSPHLPGRRRKAFQFHSCLSCPLRQWVCWQEAAGCGTGALGVLRNGCSC